MTIKEQHDFTPFLTVPVPGAGRGGAAVIPLPHKLLTENDQPWMLVPGDDWRRLIQPIYDEYKRNRNNPILMDLLLNHDPGGLFAASLNNPFYGITSASDRAGNQCLCIDKNLFNAVTKCAAIGATRSETADKQSPYAEPFQPLVAAIQKTRVDVMQIARKTKSDTASDVSGISVAAKAVFIVIGLIVATGLIAYNLIHAGVIKSPFAPEIKPPANKIPGSSDKSKKDRLPKEQKTTDPQKIKPGQAPVTGTVSIDPVSKLEFAATPAIAVFMPFAIRKRER